MDTVGFIIDEIREKLKETSDDSHIEDLLIYSTMIDVRAILIDQDLTKKKSSDINFTQSVCIDLCVDNYANCCNTPDLGIKILRSKKPIPEFITHKYLKPFFITDITGQNEIPFQERANLVWDKYFEIGELLPMPTWEMQNWNNKRYLILSGNLQIKSVLLQGVFKDVVAASLLMDCENTTNGCPDWKDTIFPISQLKVPLIDLVLEKLGRTQVTQEDNSNNGKSYINERD